MKLTQCRFHFNSIFLWCCQHQNNGFLSINTWPFVCWENRLTNCFQWLTNSDLVGTILIRKDIKERLDVYHCEIVICRLCRYSLIIELYYMAPSQTPQSQNLHCFYLIAYKIWITIKLNLMIAHRESAWNSELWFFLIFGFEIYLYKTESKNFHHIDPVSNTK